MIDQSFLDEFRVAQKEHVLDLSQDVIIGYGNSIEEDCPNCTYDGMVGASGASYTEFIGTVTVLSGTPYERTFEAKSFKRRCPICGGKGFFSAPNEKTIKAHVHWDSGRSWETYPNSPAGSSGQNTVKFKADSIYYPDFLTAVYFKVDGVRVEPSSTPIVRAMGSSDGIVEIHCSTVDIKKDILR
jgi:hypothetical protein